jgi:hypothetical protein
MQEWRKPSDCGASVEFVEHKSDGEEAAIADEIDLLEHGGCDGQLVCEGEAEPNQNDQVKTAREDFRRHEHRHPAVEYCLDDQ